MSLHRCLLSSSAKSTRSQETFGKSGATRGILAANVLHTRHHRAWNMTTTRASGGADEHAAAKAASMAERPTTAGAMSDMESWSDGSNGAGGVATELRKACGRGWGDGRDGQRLDETRRRDDGATGAGEVKAGMEDIVVQMFQGGHGRLGRRRCVQLILDNDAAGMKAERVDPQGEAALQAAVKAM